MPWHYIPLTNLLIVNLKVNCFIFLLYCFSWVVFLRRFIRVGKIKVHNPGICWQESEGTRKKDKPKHGWEKIYWPLHCKIVLTNLLKSERDYLRRATKEKWFSLKGIQGESDYLWKYDRAKVIFCEKMNTQKWLSLKIWHLKSQFIWKDDHAKGIIFWNVETARVTIFWMTEWKWLSRAKGWKGAAPRGFSSVWSLPKILQVGSDFVFNRH